ncbi:hypothetical protein ISE1_1111 [plant metagenome]|uniref:Uncharacterized protein n=1 Tax=plant metagenome TaxID=1297885 RepID=A0A484TSW2_9ZZZZ
MSPGRDAAVLCLFSRGSAGAPPHSGGCRDRGRSTVPWRHSACPYS